MVTSVSPKAFARLTLITVGSLMLALLAPAVSSETNNLHLAVAFLFAGMMGALISLAASRRQRLLDAVRVELNKLRRLYHVSKNLAATSQDYRPWFTDLHGHIYNYLNRFVSGDFESYDGYNRDFRAISYHVYTIPALHGAKEQVLFEDLLRTTAAVAEARQQIKELWDNRLSFHVWMMVLMMALMFAGSVLIAAPADTVGRLVAGFALGTGFLAVDYLWKTDSLSSERHNLSKRYVDNVGKLELGRRD